MKGESETHITVEQLRNINSLLGETLASPFQCHEKGGKKNQTTDGRRKEYKPVFPEWLPGLSLICLVLNKGFMGKIGVYGMQHFSEGFNS